eukprot:4252070-Prymnesium_polylepis.1
METVRLTLQRLADDETDDVSNRMVSANAGRPRVLSDEDDMYIGLLLCEGHSQRSATFLINGERSAQGLPPVSKHAIEEAEKRVQLWRQRRGSKKSGSRYLECAWARGSLAFAIQVQLQLRAGAELARRPTVGPTIKLTDPSRNVLCLPRDEWGILSESIR